MKRCMLLALLGMATAVLSAAAHGECTQASADGSSGQQPSCMVCGACTCVVTKTIMCPVQITETRVKYVTETKTEEHELPYTVFQRVPVTRKYDRECCYLADETKTKVITWKECRRVNNPTVQTYTTQVPETECRVGTRQVCRCIDGENVMVEEPYNCEVTVLRPDVGSKNCNQPDVVFETKSDVLSYCVKTPKKHTVECAEETVYKLEPVEKTRKVSVCVPVKVAQPVEVTVCRMVPKTIICCNACACEMDRQQKIDEAHAAVKDRVHDRCDKLRDRCAGVAEKCAGVAEKCGDLKDKCAGAKKRWAKAIGKFGKKH